MVPKPDLPDPLEAANQITGELAHCLSVSIRGSEGDSDGRRCATVVGVEGKRG